MQFYLRILSIKVLALLLLLTSGYAHSDQNYKSVHDVSKYKIYADEFDYDVDFKDDLDKKKAPYIYKHHRDMKWSEHVKEARSYFRMRLREFFQYLRRIRAAIKNPDTDWDNFDWSYPGDDDSADDDSTGDDLTGDDTSDDDSAGDETTEDDSSGDDTTGDDSSDDDTTGDDSNGDDSSGDDTTVNDSTGDDTSGDDTSGDDSGQDNNSPVQKVSFSNQPTGLLGENVELDISYDALDMNNQLSGLGFRVHYDSSILTFNSATDVLQQDLIVNAEGPISDVEDFDNNPLTNSYITFGWASLFNNWPNVSLPAALSKIIFGVSSTVDLESVNSTQVTITGITTAAGYQFESENYALGLSITDATWDYDGDGEADALTDGLIMMRYTFGLRGDTMAQGAMSTNSVMSVAQVEERVQGSMKIADIDNDGDVDALTDGLLLLRHLFAMEDDSLTHGAVGHMAVRKTKHEIKSHLNKYMPKKRNKTAND
jgi:hypothetical protein